MSKTMNAGYTSTRERPDAVSAGDVENAYSGCKSSAQEAAAQRPPLFNRP